MTYLVFDTQLQAQTALAQIWENMQPIVEINAGTHAVITPTVTSAWDVERQRLDEKWVCAKPATEYMTDVLDYVEEEYNSEWFPTEGGI